MKLEVRVTAGPDAGRLYSLEQDAVTVGRDEGNDVVLSDLKVSRGHATFLLRDGEIFVRDHSKNGTSVGGRILRKGEEAVLSVNDRVKLGLTVVELRSVVPLDVEETRATVRSDETGQTVRRPRSRAAPTVSPHPSDSAAAGDPAARTGQPALQQRRRKLRRLGLFALLVVAVAIGVVLLVKPKGGGSENEWRNGGDEHPPKRVVDIIEAYAGLDTLALSSDVLNKVKLGKTLYDERDILPQNRREARDRWQEGLPGTAGADRVAVEDIIKTLDFEIDSLYDRSKQKVYTWKKQGGKDSLMALELDYLLRLVGEDDERYDKVYKFISVNGLWKYSRKSP